MPRRGRPGTPPRTEKRRERRPAAAAREAAAAAREAAASIAEEHRDARLAKMQERRRKNKTPPPEVRKMVNLGVRDPSKKWREQQLDYHTIAAINAVAPAIEEQAVQMYINQQNQQARAEEAAIREEEENAALRARALTAKQERVMFGPEYFNMFGNDLPLHNKFNRKHARRENTRSFIENLPVSDLDIRAVTERALWPSSSQLSTRRGGKRKKRRKSRKRRVKKKTKSKKRKSKKRRRKRRKTRRKK